MNRRLAAILAADVVGYSRLMEADEPGTLVRLKARRQQVVGPLLRQYAGRLVKMMGDGILVEFGSAVNAAQCALALQTAMSQANAAEPDLPPIRLRVGINVGDVMVEGGDLYGDGVNIAARLESIAEPGAICVSGKVQDELRGKMKIDYDDLGDVALKNIALPVRVFRIGSGGAQRTIEPGVSLRPAAMPSLAILPFKNLGPDRAGDTLSDAVTEDILIEVSRFRSLRVVARRAMQDIGAGPAGRRVSASEAGADFVAEGSVRLSEDMVRVTVQLSEAASGNRIWSERYDIKPGEVDRVISAIVASLEQRMVSIAAATARLKPPSSWTAYDYLLQGRDLCNAYREPDAIPYFQKATDIDPQFALAHSWLALALIVTFSGTSETQLLERAAVHCAAALSLDTNDPTVHHANGMLFMWRGEQVKAGHHFDRALALNPADIQIRGDRANWLRYSGQLAEGLAEIEAAIEKSVACPPWFWAVRGEILFDLQRYEEALACFGNLPHRARRMTYVAAAHALLGDQARALAVAGEVLGLRPKLTELEVRRSMPHLDDAPVARLIEGMKLAGML